LRSSNSWKNTEKKVELQDVAMIEEMSTEGWDIEDTIIPL
jgi:hypothetical protein